MTNKVTNADLYGVLLEIKEDIGGLKSASEVHLKALEKHNERITTLEDKASRQKGAVKVWGLVATGAATVGGIIVDYLRPHH